MKKLLFLFCFVAITCTYAQKDKVVISIYSKAYHERLQNQAKEIETTIQDMVNKEVCEYVPASQTIPMIRKFYKGVKPTAPYLYKTFEITPDFRQWLKTQNVDYLIMAGINFSKAKKVVLFYRVLPVIEEKEDKDYLQVSTPKEMKLKLTESLAKTNIVKYTNNFHDALEQKETGWFGEDLPDGLVKTNAPGTYTWKKDESTMLYVPKGTFAYKKGESTENKMLDGYYIDKYETTNQQFANFLNKKVSQGAEVSSYIDLESPYCLIEKKEVFTPKTNTGEYPVVEVSWVGAQAYAQWAGKTLPSQEEWQKALRGSDKIPIIPIRNKGKISFTENPFKNRVFAWGNEAPSDVLPQCNYFQKSLVSDGYKWLAPVLTYSGLGDSPYGCSNMSGNVWEWCAGQTEKKICMGGAWSTDMELLENAVLELSGSETFNDVGFRSVFVPQQKK